MRCATVLRDGQQVPLDELVRLRTGDSVWLIAPDALAEPLAAAFAPAGAAGELTAHSHFFGEFVVAPSGSAGELTSAYGIALAPGEESLELRHLVVKRLGRPAVVGDRVRIGAFVLTVRKMDGGAIKQIGLKCPAVA